MTQIFTLEDIALENGFSYRALVMAVQMLAEGVEPTMRLLHKYS